VTPVIGVNGAWVRPNEVVVDTAVEDQLAGRLRELGGRPYVPSQNEDDWRQRPFAPDYGDVNARLDQAELRFHLWVGFSTRDAVRLALDDDVPGVHFNNVYLGEGVTGYYQGGPEGFATPDPGPETFQPHSGGAAADLAVHDTGVPANWPADYPVALQNTVALVDGIDPLDEPPPDGILEAQACHGLFICGVVARLNPGLTIESRRVMFSTGETDDTMVCPAITAPGPAVVNLSYGGFSTNNQISQMMADAVKAAVLQDKVLVAAAGNHGTYSASSTDHKSPFWPAAHPDVIAVGAFNSVTDKVWPLTNRADVYAPGVDLLSLHTTGSQNLKNPLTGQSYQGLAKWSGTSFATPVVAAKIAEEIAAGGLTNQDLARNWLAGLLPSSWPDTDLAATPSTYGKKYSPTTKLTSW
jgi:hypothetical protein